jgi:hypothetical protein
MATPVTVEMVFAASKPIVGVPVAGFEAPPELEAANAHEVPATRTAAQRAMAIANLNRMLISAQPTTRKPWK